MAEGKQIATVDGAAPRSVLVDMSKRYGMEPAAFEATVRATCMRPDKNGKVPSREEFAAFLLVAKEYTLNPLTKEIYAFAAKGGGIVPIVSLDGWVNLINSHGKLDGIEFSMEHNDKGILISCTCRIYRKDRSKPIEVTEYLAECKRDTDPWKMQHRMLRHKALIQCARYAFGFSGIYDEDEGEKIASAGPAMQRVAAPPAPKPPSEDDEASNIEDAVVEEIVETEHHAPDPDESDEGEQVDNDGVVTTAAEREEVDEKAEWDAVERFFADLRDALGQAEDEASVEQVYSDADPEARFDGNDLHIKRAQSLRDMRLRSIAKMRK